MDMVLLDRPFEDAQIRTRESLDLRNIGPKVWPKVLSECQSSNLRLYNLTIPSLEGIEKLRGVKKLTIEWAPKIEDLVPLFQMRGLTHLSIINAAKVRKLDGVERLAKLLELNLSGSRGSLTPKLRLASLEPVTRVPKLARFSLANARLEDDDISVLVRCKRLQHLDLSNQFDRAQFAYLAKHMNRRLKEPVASYRETLLKCEQCGANKYMITGKRMPILCRSCKGVEFEKRLSKFEALVNAA